jgi:aminomuconate-semialdehyde/2-hydroxymuconate-6-semialdehyde dehydrogenase
MELPTPSGCAMRSPETMMSVASSMWSTGSRGPSTELNRSESGNCYFVRDLRAPFGGFKDSGIGREGGRHSREFFTEAKTVVMEI